MASHLSGSVATLPGGQASKPRGVVKLEGEIEKIRSECNWRRGLDLAQQQLPPAVSKAPGIEPLLDLLRFECSVETYLREHPPVEANFECAKSNLTQVKDGLCKLIRSDIPPDMGRESRLLLAKIYFATGELEDSLNMYQQTNLDQFVVDAAQSHLVRMLAEAYAIYGMCLEKIMPQRDDRHGPDSPPPLSPMSDDLDGDPEKAIVQCFERSGDLSLLYLQESDKMGQNIPTYQAYVEGGQILPTGQNSVGPVLDSALRRGPLLRLKAGDLPTAVGRFRRLLQAVEARSTKQLRQTLARQLAEVLLRGVSEHSYRQVSPPPASKSDLPFRLPASPSAVEPRRHKAPNGESLFCPNNQHEETLLLLIISECLANQEAVLNRSSEHEASRAASLRDTTIVYDLLTLCLGRWAQFNVLADSFERAMKFSFEDFHVWYQFGLSLICAGKYPRALLVLDECAKMQPKNYQVRLMASRICLERLNKLEVAFQYAEEAAEAATDAHDVINAARGRLCMGLARAFQSETSRLHSERQSYHKSAVESLCRAAALDSYDHLAHFHLACLYANNRQIGLANAEVRKALELRPDHLPSLHLLALLLTSQRKLDEALTLLTAALKEYPDDLSLLLTRSRIEEEIGCIDEALTSVKTALRIWRETQEAEMQSHGGDGEETNRGTGLLERVTNDKRQMVQIQISELSDRDSGGGASLTTPSLVTTSRVDQTISDAASSWSLSYSHLRAGPRSMWEIQVQLWLHLADHYLRHDHVTDAHAAVMEAVSIGQGLACGPQVIFMRGRIHEASAEFEAARRCYADVIAIVPDHLKASVHLGRVTLYLGSARLAEKILRDAVRLDPRCEDAWRALGQVLESLGEHSEAASCFLTALDLESTAPILPFALIPRALQ